MTIYSRREEWEYVRGTTLQTPKSVKQKGQEVLQMSEQRFPCSPWSRPWWGRVSPCRSPPAPHGGPHGGAGGCLKGAVTPWEAHVGAGSWRDLRNNGERSPCWSRLVGRACDCWAAHQLSVFNNYRFPLLCGNTIKIKTRGIVERMSVGNGLRKFSQEFSFRATSLVCTSDGRLVWNSAIIFN